MNTMRASCTNRARKQKQKQKQKQNGYSISHMAQRIKSTFCCIFLTSDLCISHTAAQSRSVLCHVPCRLIFLLPLLASSSVHSGFLLASSRGVKVCAFMHNIIIHFSLSLSLSFFLLIFYPFSKIIIEIPVETQHRAKSILFLLQFKNSLHRPFLFYPSSFFSAYGLPFTHIYFVYSFYFCFSIKNGAHP